MSSRAAALAAGIAVFVLVTAISALAWAEGAPFVAEPGGTTAGSAAWALWLLAAAFVLYLVGLALLRGGSPPQHRSVVTLAAAIQLVPLAAPLLVSTDAWTYWDYGWIAAVGEGNPYADAPNKFPQSPAYPYTGAAWRDTTSVYGPAFTLVSEPVARAVGSSADAAAWTYKAIAALAAVAATLLAGRLASRRVAATAFVGWNPLLAVHLAGGGHNDAWVAALVMIALALAAGLAPGLAARPRTQLAGAAWVLAIAVKWVPAVFLGLVLLARRNGDRARIGAVGLAGAALAVAIAASWRYGLAWLAAPLTLAGNAALETGYALPARLEQLGVPDAVAGVVFGAALVAGLALLARAARRGRLYIGRAALLVLLTTPYLAIWYLVWAVAPAASEEDRWAKAGCLGLGAYLLPQGIAT